MGRLVYSAIASLDLYVEDAEGNFSWAAPGEEVHAFVNELERPVATYLYGRRMYETMRVWETIGSDDPSRAVRDFAEIWRTAEKIVFSRTLESTSSERTRIERSFDPEQVRELKRQSHADLSIGGAELAGEALAAGLVDECQLLLSPIVVGAGKPVFPERLRLDLELLDERRFRSGVVYLRYAVAGSG